MPKHTVVVTNKVNLAGVEKMKEEFTVYERTRDTDTQTWEKWLGEADAIYSPSGMKIDGTLLDKAPKVKVVSQVAVGYDNIDVEACSKRGILVGNTPGVVTDATADMAFGLLLCSARYLHKAWLHVKNGEWGNRRPFMMGTDLKGKLLGIVGLGSVGFALSQRAKASGMKIAYHNRKESPKVGEIGAQYMQMDELLMQADFVALTLPLNSATRKMFGKEEFAKMKPSARFINAARGALVDTDALYEALSTGKIAYAALDVTDPEPLPGDHPLLGLENVVIFPHIGGYTKETRDAMSVMALENMVAALEGRQMPSCVNCDVMKK